MTKQKTIESLRYEYLKSINENDQNKLVRETNDLNFVKLQQAVSKGSFHPINIPSNISSSTKPAPHPRSSYASQLKTNSTGRFNLNEYMKTLDSKLKIQAPISSHLVGNQFQEYLLKERESYLKNVNEFEGEAPLIRSVASKNS